MPLEDPVYRTAESIHKIMMFTLYRVPPEKRGRFLSRVRGKIEDMDPVEMSGKKVPINSTIGQAITVTKNILNGLNPHFIQQVLNQLVIILSQYKGEKKAMLRTAQIDVVIEPFDSAVQSAVRRMKLHPTSKKLLEGVTKIIVHRGAGGGKLGYVQSGQGQDARAIHLYKTPILEQAKRQSGGATGQALDEAFEQALVEVIGHEGAHIQTGTGPHQPFGDEHAAERGAGQAMSIFPADDGKPISKRVADRRPISIRAQVKPDEDEDYFFDVDESIYTWEVDGVSVCELAKLFHNFDAEEGTVGGASYFKAMPFSKTCEFNSLEEVQEVATQFKREFPDRVVKIFSKPCRHSKDVSEDDWELIEVVEIPISVRAEQLAPMDFPMDFPMDLPPEQNLHPDYYTWEVDGVSACKMPSFFFDKKGQEETGIHGGYSFIIALQFAKMCQSNSLEKIKETAEKFSQHFPDSTVKIYRNSCRHSPEQNKGGEPIEVIKKEDKELEQNALDRTDVGYGDNSGQGLAIADPAATRETQVVMPTYEYNAGNTGGGQTDSGAAQGGYGGADSGGSTYGLFSIPHGFSPGTI